MLAGEIRVSCARRTVKVGLGASSADALAAAATRKAESATLRIVYEGP